MRAVVLRRHGPAEILSLESVPDPTTGSEQVLVAVEAIGLNFAEVLSRKGLYGWSPDLPYVLGMEAVGVIEEIGDRVEGREIGERVLVASQFGSYAEKIAVTASSALPALDSYTPEENAAFGVNYMTAWVSLLEMARIRHTDRVLVTAAAGGVGTAAVQIASSFGCEVVALASSDAREISVQQTLYAMGISDSLTSCWTLWAPEGSMSPLRRWADTSLKLVRTALPRSAGLWSQAMRSSTTSCGTRSRFGELGVACQE